jgi:hypothetical protein
MSGFQKQVNLTPAPAVAGDFASANPRSSVVAPEGGFVAGSGGVTVARFAWAQSDGTVLNADASAVPSGFVHREQQALISTYLAESGNLIPAGLPVTIMRDGDYYFTANTNAAVLGQKVFASKTDGSTRTGAAGATITGYTETAFTVSRACLTGELGVMTL